MLRTTVRYITFYGYMYLSGNFIKQQGQTTYTAKVKIQERKKNTQKLVWKIIGEKKEDDVHDLLRLTWFTACKGSCRWKLMWETASVSYMYSWDVLVRVHTKNPIAGNRFMVHIYAFKFCLVIYAIIYIYYSWSVVCFILFILFLYLLYVRLLKDSLYTAAKLLY